MKPHHVSGSKLYDLVQRFRKRGYTAHFGADRDPKKRHNS